MGGIDLKYDEQLFNDATAAFNAAAGQLQELVSQAKTWAQDLQGGALLGAAGEALSEGFSGVFSSQVTKLSDKLKEIAADIQTAEEKLIAGRKKAEELFKNK